MIALIAAVGAINNRGAETETVETGTSSDLETDSDQESEPTVEDAASTTVSEPEPTTTVTVETTVLVESTEVVPSTPLAMPLSTSEISELTDIPIDEQGWDEIFGPANSPQFCNVRPDITGLVETMAAVYPIDPTVGGNLQQVTIRMYRFDSTDRASDFLVSATEIPCVGWEADGNSLRADVTDPLTRFGDETRQVDQVITLPNGVDLLTRSIFVQGGTDIMKLVFLTIDPADLDPITDSLATQAAEALGY